MGDGFVEVADHLHGELQVEELGRPVGLASGCGTRQERARNGVGHELDTFKLCRHARQEHVGHVAMYEEGLCRVAHRWALHLGVDDDARRHVEVGGCVDVDVAVAVPVDHIGHGGVLEDRRDERRTTARDEHVDCRAQAHELDRRLTARVVDEHDRVGG